MITDISKSGNVVSVTQGTNQPINYFGAKGGYYFNGTTLHLSINKDEYQVAFANLTVGGVAPADVAAAKTALSTVFPDANSGNGGTGLTAYASNTTVLTNSQFKGLPTVPVQIMPAPPEGKINIAISIAIIKNFSVAYDSLDAGNEDYLNLRYGQFEPNDADIAYLANSTANPNLNLFLTSTGQKVAILPLMNQINDASWNIISRTINWPATFFQEGLWIGGNVSGGDLTGGDNANSLNIIVGYLQVDL